jgi:putative heme-binding domain-containing protein
MRLRNRSVRRLVGMAAIGVWVILASTIAAAELPDYATANPALRIVRLDSAPTESFLAVKADTTGRLFVGGREALFVYELDANGLYQPRRELLRFPDHTWVYDIEILGDDLYLLTVSALYVVKGGRVEREGLQARRLVWGVPMGHVHQCFHGLTIGPEGDIYFSMGDPLWYYGDFNRADHWGHWTFFSKQPDGSNWHRTPYNGVGGVFRCRPDGTRFQVVATGLRNSCGLTFDRNWNLFSNDNDHEGMPHEYVPGRLNHVTPHAWFAWPRGWMVSKTPDRKDMLDTMLTTMGRAVPVGQSYYDDTFLPEKYRNSLLVARWCTRQITFYPLKHKGATFECDEHELIAGRDLARPVHVSVGRGGRIFATICYMAHNEASPVYKSDLVMITRADDADNSPFEGYDAPSAPLDKLWNELAHPDWSRCYRAHLELVRRGPAVSAAALARLKNAKGDDPSIGSLVWIAAASSKSGDALPALIAAAAHRDASVRLQAIRALGEFAPQDVPESLLIGALKDADPLVQHAAVLALFGRRGSVPPEIVNGPARSDDTYLRQAATLLMAEKGTYDLFGNLTQSGDAKARLAGVLAAGFQLTIPHAVAPLADNLPLSPWRNKEANVIEYADGKVDLRELGRVGTFTVAEHWKAGKHTDAQEKLFALLAARLADEDEAVRLQAAHFLYMLNDPRTEGVVARVRSDVEKARLSTAPITSIGRVWLAGPFPDGESGLNTVHPPQSGPFDPAATYQVGDSTIAWREAKPVANSFYHLREIFGPCDGASMYAFTRLESGTKQQVMLLVGSDDGVKVWQNGRAVWTNDKVRGALPFQDVVALELQPGSNDLLIRVRNVAGDSGMYLHYRSLGPVAAVLPEKLGIAGLAERLKQAAADPNATKVDGRFLDIDWTKAAAAGNAETGRKLFSADGLGCAKCHAATQDAAVTGGQSLAEAGKRFTVAHLVESVLLPNKQVSPVFKATQILTKEGKTLTGLEIGETAEKVEMILSDTTRLSIPTADIDARKLQEVSPMPAGLVKTTDELRDLLAFLLANGGKER